MKRWKKMTIGFLLLFIAIQFVRSQKNKSVVLPDNTIIKIYQIPSEVQTLLKNACYDCHSNYTSYPWYAEVQPFGWILSRHISKGKSELNFDEFGSYKEKRKKSKLKAIADEVSDGQMPLKSYTWLHSKARLSEAEKKMLFNWIDTIK